MVFERSFQESEDGQTWVEGVPRTLSPSGVMPSHVSLGWEVDTE
jgi:hypothetical protein